MKQEIIAIGDSGNLESNKSRTAYKITISIIFGLIGFVINFHAFDYLFPPYSATILIGLLFPILISLNWGWKYGLLSALAGGCQSVWWIWGPSNGYATFIVVPPFTLWVVWHGYFAYLRRKRKDYGWWLNKYIVEIPFRILSTINLYTLARWAITLNPPPWGWAADSANVIPMHFSSFVVVKQAVVAYIILLLADVLLNFRFVKRFFRLKERTPSADTGHIISVSFLFGVLFWIVDSIFCYLIFHSESSFLDLLALNIPPYVLYVRTAFILACLAGGTVASGFLTKRKQAEAELLVKNWVFEASITANSTSDNEGILTYVNNTFIRLFGYENKEEAVGKPISDFLKFEDEAMNIITALNESGVWEGEYTGLKKDGTTFTAYGLATTIKDKSGDSIGYQSAVLDISDRKRMEKTLRESEEKYRLLAENTLDFIWQMDVGFKFTYVNPSIFQMVGFTQEEWIGSLLSNHCSPENMEFILGLTKEEIKKGKESTGVKFETYLLHRNGKEIAVEVTYKILFDKDENPIGFQGNARDITERKQAQQELQKSHDELELRVKERTTQLEASMYELEAFAYSVSHDLQTPLRAISGFSEILLKDYLDTLDDKGQHYLQRVRAGTVNMSQMIEDLLTLSRIGRRPINKKRVDLEKLVKETYELLSEAERKDRKVDFTVKSCPPVSSDPQLLKIVLNNLLSNALKFSGKCKKAEIEFGFKTEDEKTIFYVKDNGIGFDMKYADKLFAPFQRLHKEEEYEGSGIGLATVQRIIHRHGGEIWVESIPGSGSTFYFTL